jgi:hypothetical protein
VAASNSASLSATSEVVVDAPQQHGLVEQRRTVGAQRTQRRTHRSVNLVGVVGMNDDDFLQRNLRPPAQEPCIDAFGQHDRQARMDAQASQVADPGQLAGQRLEPSVAQHQRIAAAQYDLADARVAAQELERGLEAVT